MTTPDKIDRICKNCGHSYGKHNAAFDFCPEGDPENRDFDKATCFEWNQAKPEPTYAQLQQENSELRLCIKLENFFRRNGSFDHEGKHYGGQYAADFLDELQTKLSIDQA